jgi:hypothetical protein
LAQAFNASFQEVQWIVLAYLLAVERGVPICGSRRNEIMAKAIENHSGATGDGCCLIVRARLAVDRLM